MTRKSKKSLRSTSRWRDPDDAPLITKAMLDRAEVRDGNKVIRRGRPPLGSQSKVPVTIRLDADIVAAYRKQGSGWQSRLNADLRRFQSTGATLKTTRIGNAAPRRKSHHP